MYPAESPMSMKDRVKSKQTNATGRATASAAVVVLACAGLAGAQISTVPTMDAAALADALEGTGMTITSVIIRSGRPGQIGTYSNFNLPPATIRDGIVLSSGDVTNMGPLVEVLNPAYNPASPPAAVSTLMYPEASDGSTPEFNAFGSVPGNIENFRGAYDVAAVEVHFELAERARVQFDFIFGSVEFPVFTSSFTDAFLVFLNGTDPVNQINRDVGNRPVQVGVSFAGYEVTSDRNTAFALPHALIHHLTTTTAELPAGEHVIIFEVGDVNDQVLDSAVFISGLRTGVGVEGTEPTDGPGAARRCSPADVGGGGPDGLRFDGMVDGTDFIVFVNSFAIGDARVDAAADIVGGGASGLEPDGNIDGTDFIAFINGFAAGC